ncbi:TolC family protein [Burkholderiaceae bacterium FT117]|uniref:TolC family protein n=1 Tax=Zeimonas sediminis TaxID=2944268 RepID=UPI002342DDFE|nr:TolC family protein [Zeimonas sediminis]MCM5571127.1 TolC family protein [Zeimonas sediminis]
MSILETAASRRRPGLAGAACLVLCLAAAFAAPCAAGQPAPAAEGGAAGAAGDVRPEALSLADAQAAVAAGSRSLEAARLALEAARGALDSASRKPNPTLSLGTGTAQQGAYSPRDLDAYARLEQLIERGNKRALRTEAASRTVQAAQLDLEDTLRQLRLALARAYYALKSAQDGVAFAERDAQSLARSLDAARRRLRAGDIARADVARIEVEAGQADNALRFALAQREAARLALARVMAREADAVRFVAADDWPGLDAGEPAPERLMAAVERRPDVLAAAQRLAAAQARFDEARAQRTRDVSVGLFADRNRLGNGGTTFGVSVTVPLFVNNDLSGDIRQAEAQLDGARVALEQARADALLELRAARVRAAASADRLARIERQIMPSAEEAARATEFAYERGALPLTDLLDARRRLQASARDLAEARVDHAIARAELEASLSEAGAEPARR